MIWKPGGITREEIANNGERRLERVEKYLAYGHDRVEAISFVIDVAGPVGSAVLDIGTGNGFAAIELAKRGARVVSVDTSGEKLRTAWMNADSAGVLSRIEFHLLDANELPFEDETFELVAMINLLHHVPTFDRIMREVTRVLESGGKLLVSDFTEEGFGILDRIHEDEGRVHDRVAKHGIDELAEWLPRFGLQCLERDIRFQQYAMLAVKP